MQYRDIMDTWYSTPKSIILNSIINKMKEGDSLATLNQNRKVFIQLIYLFNIHI